MFNFSLRLSLQLSDFCSPSFLWISALRFLLASKFSDTFDNLSFFVQALIAQSNLLHSPRNCLNKLVSSWHLLSCLIIILHSSLCRCSSNGTCISEMPTEIRIHGRCETYPLYSSSFVRVCVYVHKSHIMLHNCIGWHCLCPSPCSLCLSMTQSSS